MREFELMKEDAHWWTLNDYACVVDVVRRLNARTVLEFGPGHSTLALIEGGATHIDALEDDPVWADTHRERLQAVHPLIVRIHDYVWADPLQIHIAGVKLYDLALIDGPKQTPRRAVALRYALARCVHVLVPLEEGSGEEIKRMRETVESVAREEPIEWIENTGPLAGAFALIGPPC